MKKWMTRVIFISAAFFLILGAVPFALPQYNATWKMLEITRGLHDATIACASWWEREHVGYVTCTAIGRVHDRDAEEEALWNALRQNNIPQKMPNHWRHLAIEARCPAFPWSTENCAIISFSETNNQVIHGGINETRHR